MKKRTLFLTDYIANQYPIDKFKDIILITLDIVENFLLTLERGFDYNSITINTFEEKYSSTYSSSSKIESIYIKNLKNHDSMINFLECFYNAYKSLNTDEKVIFDATFIDKLTDLEIIEKYNTYSNYINIVRKSAIVRFCLKAGLDRFVDVI